MQVITIDERSRTVNETRRVANPHELRSAPASVCFALTCVSVSSNYSSAFPGEYSSAIRNAQNDTHTNRICESDQGLMRLLLIRRGMRVEHVRRIRVVPRPRAGLARIYRPRDTARSTRSTPRSSIARRMGGTTIDMPMRSRIFRLHSSDEQCFLRRESADR